ncbi:MAG: hypothetical protein K6E83_05880 [Clostridium sp.]|nr:hypothetical protein [Clostridium sp.]
MDNFIFRKKSLERISSPEAMNDYLRVTGPAVWLVLAAVVILLAGILAWSTAVSIDSFAAGRGSVKDGTMYIRFDDDQVARNVESGMTVTAGKAESRITSVGTDDDGDLFALAPTDLSDGNYTVEVHFRQTQVIRLLFN